MEEKSHDVLIDNIMPYRRAKKIATPVMLSLNTDTKTHTDTQSSLSHTLKSSLLKQAPEIMHLPVMLIKKRKFKAQFSDS
jgi:hypothetical protein